MRRTLLTCLLLLVLVALTGPSAAAASAPTVTLSDPANGALITTGQPTFSGSATDTSGDSGQITISIFAGSSANGVPVQILHTTASNGGFSASAIGLPDGTYTAVASEPDIAGDIGSSQPDTFQLFTGTPGLTLKAPAAPIETAAPTFTGTAETNPGDAQTVNLIVYPGDSTDATPVAVLSGSVTSGGAFSIQVLPGLAAGSYTAVASQPLVTHTTFSPSVAFKITTTAAALTVTSPRAGATEPQTGLVFGGGAGDDYGDSTSIDLTLYRGTKATGTPVGTATVQRSGSSWSDRWAATLALGTYTLSVSQDNVVNSATTITRTFKVAAPGSVTGAITISATGRLSAHLSCLTGAGTCKGDVLIVTKNDFRPVYGGPLGPLALMFDNYSVAASKTATLRSQLTPDQLSALRRAGASKLVVTVAYSVGSSLSEVSHVTGAVKVG